MSPWHISYSNSTSCCSKPSNNNQLLFSNPLDVKANLILLTVAAGTVIRLHEVTGGREDAGSQGVCCAAGVRRVPSCTPACLIKPRTMRSLLLPVHLSTDWSPSALSLQPWIPLRPSLASVGVRWILISPLARTQTRPAPPRKTDSRTATSCTLDRHLHTAHINFAVQFCCLACSLDSTCLRSCAAIKLSLLSWILVMLMSPLSFSLCGYRLKISSLMAPLLLTPLLLTSEKLFDFWTFKQQNRSVHSRCVQILFYVWDICMAPGQLKQSFFFFFFCHCVEKCVCRKNWSEEKN